MKSLKKVSGLIRSELSNASDTPMEEKVQNQLKESWRKHAGESVMHTFPLLFKSRRLVVFCNSSIWSTSLRHQQTTLIRKLKEDGIDIEEIKIKVQPVSQPQRQRTRETALLSESNAKQIRSMANGLTHPGLKKALIKLSDHKKKNPNTESK